MRNRDDNGGDSGVEDVKRFSPVSSAASEHARRLQDQINILMQKNNRMYN